MRLEVVAPPELAHGGFTDPLGSRHRSATPMRAPFWFGLQGGVDYGLDASCIIGGFAASARSDFPKRWEAAGAEAFPPETDRLAVHAILGRHVHLGLTSGKSQNDPAAQCYLLRGTQSHQPALEFATLVRRQNERGNDTGHN